MRRAMSTAVRAGMLLAAAVGAVALSGCATVADGVQGVASAAADARQRLADLCGSAGKAYQGVVDAEAGLRQGELTAAEWRAGLDAAADGFAALGATAPAAVASGVQAVADAVRSLPQAPSGDSGALGTVEAAMRPLDAACSANGSPIALPTGSND